MFNCVRYTEVMYVATIPNRNSPPALLLRESFRQNGKVKNRTLANLSHWPAARRIRPGRRPVAGPSTGTGLWTALRAEADGRRAGHRGGAGSQPVSEAGFVPGVGPCRPPGFTLVGGALGRRPGGG